MSTDGFFIWNTKLDLNIPLMDQEHKEIVQIMNEIYSSVQKKDEFPIQLSLVKKLYQVTEKHFSDEEKYFDEILYTKKNTHKLIHFDLLKKFKEIMTEIEKQKKIPNHFFDFLKVWLTAHIMGVDKGYSQSQAA